MPSPVIVVDDAIAHAEAALASLGTVYPVPSAELPAALAELRPQALIVRSVTRVDASLLDRAPSLGLVGTATAGTDHLDHVELARRGIAVASAAGCNARAVAEWILTALTRVAPALAPELRAGPVGVVGWGQVGSRVASLLRAVGFEVLGCDPPLARTGGPLGQPEALVEFDELWRRCSIVSFHVPLIRDGPDQTLAYLDRESPAIAGLPKLILNSSRGPVVRDEALDRPDIEAAVLDVWDHEPRLRAARLRDPKLLLASPHVAGYSLEGKIAATRMMHEALSAWLERPPVWTGASLLPIHPVDDTLASRSAILAKVVDLAGDDRRTRALAALGEGDRAREFEALRRGYALRREFSAWTVGSAHPDANWLYAAGFSHP